MPNNHTQTSTITNSSWAQSHQDMIPDYTGIYCFCGTIFIISIITLIIISKLSEKWRMDKYKIDQMKVIKSCEMNNDLMNKLNEVLEVLSGINK